MGVSVDTTIRYRDYNTIRLDAPARFFCTPYFVQGMTAISHGLYVYDTQSRASAVRARTRFIGNDGRTISTVDHSFAIQGGIFTWIKIEGVEVPAAAKQAKLELLCSSGRYWAGLIKTESGAIATDFTVNFSGQMTKITASGVYTGTVQANQIIIAGSDERLSQRLVTINAYLISLSDRITSQGTIVSRNYSTLSALGLRVGEIETKNGQQDTKLTEIAAGKITLSSVTSGKIAGMTLTSSTLRATSGGNGIQISGNGANTPIWVGDSGFNTPVFAVYWDGSMYATNATIKGTIRAGSIINGSLNNVDGSYKGYINGSNGVFNGYSSGVLDGSLRTGNGYFGGRLDDTWGSHGGSLYSSYGSLGGVNYSREGSDLYWSGRMNVAGHTTAGAGLLCYGLLNVLGDIRYRGSLTYTSDARLKTRIRKAESELVDALYGLSIKRFVYKDRPEQERIGLIAQEVARKCPPALSRLLVAASDGYMYLDYNNLHSVSVMAIQDLHKRLQALERKEKAA